MPDYIPTQGSGQRSARLAEFWGGFLAQPGLAQFQGGRLELGCSVAWREGLGEGGFPVGKHLVVTIEGSTSLESGVSEESSCITLM